MVHSSTEKTITIEADGKYFNIPTIIDGKEVSKEMAVQHFHDSKQHMGMYGSQEEAVSEAKKRSERIGKIRKGW